MTDLNACPYCNKKARLWPSYRESDAYGSFESIGCYNAKCPVEPTTGYMSYPVAVKTWNAMPSMGDGKMNNDRATEILLATLITANIDSCEDACRVDDDVKALFHATAACNLLDVLNTLTGNDKSEPAYEEFSAWFDNQPAITCTDVKKLLERIRARLEDYYASVKRKSEAKAV